LKKLARSEEFNMLFLLLQICFAGPAVSDESTTIAINKFAHYTGNTTYVEGTDGSCIACNGDCVEENVVKPHSWSTLLVFTKNGEEHHEDFELCQEYAYDVVQFGAVAFTWTKSTYSCSIHVLDSKENIQEEMKIYNGFDWKEENHNNTGPLFLATWPSGKPVDNLDSMCYYGLHITGPKNISSMMNKLIIAGVIILMIGWNGWMKYTENFPSEAMSRPSHSRSSHDHDHEVENDIYRVDPSDDPEVTGKKNE